MTQNKLPFHLSDPDLFHTDSYVHGAWTTARSRRRFEVVDPGSEQAWASCPDCAAEDVDAAVQSAHTAFQTYSRFSPRKRAQLLLSWHTLISAAKDDLSKILTYETGKPLAEATAELDYAMGFVWWFAGEAERISGSVYNSATPNRRVLTIKQPLGVAVALVPWNFPTAMILRKAGAALAAGCTMIVKPSPETPLTTLCLAYLATKAGFPPGVLNILTTSLENTPPLSEALCLHPLVKKVTFTGSTRVGKIIAGLCAQTLKKSTLELGGNCPFIIFSDAGLDEALTQLMALKWRHAGQACITANRVLVQEDIYDKFTKMCVEWTKKNLKIGHGASPGTTLGPVTTPRGLDKARELIDDAIKHGAEIPLGSDFYSTQMPKRGYFHAPTIITSLPLTLPSNSVSSSPPPHTPLITTTECFTPILVLQSFQTESQALEAANNTPLGLASYVFTKNVDRLWRMFEGLEAGMVGLNTGNSSAAEAPFGGWKESGWGKESGMKEAVEAYLGEKTGTLTLGERRDEEEEH